MIPEHVEHNASQKAKVIEKVTIFITRDTKNGNDLLLFEHPNAGIQIPAGTVEANETPQETAIREAFEETGLQELKVSSCLGISEDILTENQRIITKSTKIFSRPDLKSFDWAFIRSGITVTVNRTTESFTQIRYQEYDQLPDPKYISYSITGWVPNDVLANTCRRYFYHLVFSGTSPAHWEIISDNHTFSPFWAPLKSLPRIIPPQNEWVAYILEAG
jgi:8-oxo-dGTP pyrophosphatase MutT (NUDIX family)